MNQITAELLNKQYYHEVSNSLKYQRLANFFAIIGLTGIEKFLSNQAKGEFDHAQKVIVHMADIKAPLQSGSPSSYLKSDSVGFGVESIFDLLEIFQEILEIEKNTTELLINLEAQAKMAGDVLTSQWLYDSAGLLKEQIEEESIIETILLRIQQRMLNDTATGGINYDIDVWIDQEFNK